MLERTEGAPDTPAPTDLEEYRRELQKAVANGVLTTDQRDTALAQFMAEAARAPARPPSPSPARAKRPASLDREAQDAERGLAEMRAGAESPGAGESPYGTGRTGRSVSRLEQEGMNMMNARQFGSRYGGGAPFTSKEEAEAYERRNLLSESQKAELRKQGVSERDIIDMQRSEYDRAAAQTGRSGSSGWVPVWGPNGTVMYLERGTDTGFAAAGIQGASNLAEGMQRTGPRVEAGQVRPDLNTAEYERMMLERGMSLVNMEGPYGTETVWKRTGLADSTRDRLRDEGRLMIDPDGPDGPLPEREINVQEYMAREQKEGLRRRLALQAGLSPQDAADMSVQNLRDMVSANRMRRKNELGDAARLARMAPRMRNEVELGRMPENWRNAIAARQFNLPGPTPLGVQAAEGANAMELARQMVRGLEASDSTRDALTRQKMSSDAAERAREIAKEMGIVPNTRNGADRDWLGNQLATPEQLLEIQERVESEYPGFGPDSTRGWRPRAPRPAPGGGAGPANVPDPLGHVM